MMQPDDPPFLTVGTEVSAKYKGAFCEAKVHKVVKIVKVKVSFKYGLGSAVVTDECIKGVLKVGSQVKALHSDKNQHLDGIVNKIQDCSQYTVVFDDGDITTLRRSSLCLKSGRHFAESETLDQLPLTHPEHFGTPVEGVRRGRRSRQNHDSDEGSSDEDHNHSVHKRHRSCRDEWEADAGKVVCVEVGDKKKKKDNWFPGLVVAPTAQDTVKIETKKDYLVRSFQDGRYYTVPKKEATSFTREMGHRVSQSSLKSAVDKALQYIDKDEIPPHWDRDILFGNDVSDSDFNKDFDSDTSDDEPREEKDHFVAQLYKYMEECGTPMNKAPMIGGKDLDLYRLFNVVQKLGGFNRVMNQNQWKVITTKMKLVSLGTQSASLVKSAYKRYLQSFEDFYRKLGCTMLNSPRSSRSRHRSGRSLIRDCDRNPRTLRRKGNESCDSTDERKDDDDRKEYVKEEDVKNEDVKNKDVRKEDVRKEDVRKEDVRKEDVRKEDVRKEDVRKEDVRKEDVRKEDVRKEDHRKEDHRKEDVMRQYVKKEVVKKEDVKKEVNKKEDVKKEVVKKDDVKKEVVKKDDMKKEVVKKEVVKKEVVKKEDAKKDNAKKDDAKKDDAKKDDAKKDDAKKDDAKKDDSKKDDVKKYDVTPSRRESKRKEHEMPEVKDLEKKKEESRLSRNRTPPIISSRNDSPTTRERSKELKVLMRTEVKTRLYKKESKEGEIKPLKEEVKMFNEEPKTKILKEQKNDESESEEEEIEVANTRSLRNREEKEKETDSLKKCEKKSNKLEHHQRSTSCNSTSSGTSSSSSSGSTCTSSSTSNLVDAKNAGKNYNIKLLKNPNSPLDESRKRGRKKKLEDDQGPATGKSFLPMNVPICVGDKLRVLYGPNNKELKVTYEAKVLEVDECCPQQRKYYVHYLGWNTRYDEWVIRRRIAQNLTWCQARTKKSRSLLHKKEEENDKKIEESKEKDTGVANAHNSAAKKSQSSLGLRWDSEPASKAMTRSESANQSSSESPLPERRRSRRNISHVQDTEESESDDFESESEQIRRMADVPPSPTRSEGMQLSSLTSSPSHASPEPHEEENDDEENDDEENDDEENDDEENDDEENDDEENDDEENDDEENDDEEKDDEEKDDEDKLISIKEEGVSSCGKDIDMKAIESEMKGLDRPIKKEENVISGCILATAIQASLTITEKKKHDPKKPFDSPVKRVEIPVRLVPAHEIMGQIKLLPIGGMKKESLLEEDIYEFKEPEPFEMGEMRTRKEGKGKAGEDGEFEVPVKRKGGSCKEGEDVSESDSDVATTPQKKTPQKESKDSPVRKCEPRESPMKKDLLKSKEVKKDYPIIPEVKEESDDHECRRSESPPCLQIKESDEASETCEKPLFIDLPLSRVPVPIDLKNLKIESLDGQEIHMIGSSVVVTPKKITKDCIIGDVKSDTTPIKNESEKLCITPRTAVTIENVEDSAVNTSKELVKNIVLSESMRLKPLAVTGMSRIPSGSGHVFAQVVIPPMESRLLIKPKVDSKSIEKNYNIHPAVSVTAKYEEAKPVPFSQRQQHIFPHLLKRSDNTEDKEIVPQAPVSPINIAGREALAASPQKNIVIKNEPELDKSIDKLKVESTTVEESIEAVVNRARQDLMQNEEEKKAELKSYEKRRRNPCRSKKALSREFLPDSSEESDAENNKGEKTEFGRQKRLRGENQSKYSPSKRLSKGASDADKKHVRRVDEEERANDADEEDNENNYPVLNIPSKEAIKRRKEVDSFLQEPPVKEARLIKKRRRSSLTMKKSEDSEETGLGDLLCEETIPPGSPMTHDPASSEIDAPISSIKQEMPFASVPTGSSFGKRVPLPPHQATFHPSSCVQIPPVLVPISSTVSSQPISVSSLSQYQPSLQSLNKKSSYVAPVSSSIDLPPIQNTFDGSALVRHPNIIPPVGPSADANLIEDQQPKIVIRPAVIPNIDNTPPTTPESIVSTLSDSPRRYDENVRMEENSTKYGQDSSELECNKTDICSEDSTNTMDNNTICGERTSSATAITCTQSPSEDWDTEEGSSLVSKKRKRATKLEESESANISPLSTTSKRKLQPSPKSVSLREEESANYGLAALSFVASNVSGSKSRFNFIGDLDTELNPTKRIAELQYRMQELKRTYMKVKCELASVERRRKKLRRKEKEKEAQVEAT